MTTFILVFTLFGFDAPDSVYIVDFNMTGEDCVQALVEHNDRLSATFADTDFSLACEIDKAPPMDY